MTTPIFKPFVLVRIPLPDGYTHGEVFGLNNSNQAVGWLWNDDDEIANAFFFDPKDGVTILDTDAINMDAAWAHSISDETPPTIAGVVIWKDQPDYQRAALWDGPEDQAYVPFGTGVVSAAYGVKGVASASTLAGMYVVSGDERSVVYVEGSGASYPASGVNGEARALNESGKVVGWHMVSSVSHAYSWVSNTTTDIHPNGYDASGAMCVNSTGHIGGWVEDDGEGIPALWTPLFFGVYTVDPFPVGASAMVTAINSHGEMAITRDGTTGVAIWSKRAGVDHSDLLDDLTLMRDGGDVLHSAWAINENGWIGGSFLEGGTGDPQPCLVIPYDVNNNGDPDYREILDGVEADDNENWLIDWAESVYTGSGYEGMRVGLHSPNAASNPEGSIDPAQIVRLGVNVGPHGISRSSLIEDEMWIEDIVDPSSGCDCETMFNAVTAWGTGEGRANNSLTSEVLIRVHSMMAGETFDDYETLPDPSAPEDREEALADLKNFAYRFARCIDFLQWGNESFGGARQYVFRGDEFNSACDFTTGTKAFSQLSDTCKQEAIELILAWQKDLMWAALEGSALAGRPLRMTSAGVFSSSVRNGYGENNAGRYFVTRLSEWSNENQVYLSLHNHYQTVADATDAIKKLVGLSPYTSPPWDVPNWRISTEVSAIADFDHSWWTGNNHANRKEFARYFFSGDGNPSQTYETFVTDWLTDANGQWGEDGARLDTVFDSYAEAGFTGICWAALQWQTGSSWQDLSPYLIGGLRAIQVRSNAFFESTNQSNRFSPLKTDYEGENAGGKYNISGFEPHGEGCDLEDVCPDCN